MLIALTIALSFTYGWLAAVKTADILDKIEYRKRERAYQLEQKKDEDLIPIPTIRTA